MAFIKKKIKAGDTEVPEEEPVEEPEPSNVIDIMSLLRQSLGGKGDAANEAPARGKKAGKKKTAAKKKTGKKTGAKKRTAAKKKTGARKKTAARKKTTKKAGKRGGASLKKAS
jgi:hypothetical protein